MIRAVRCSPPSTGRPSTNCLTLSKGTHCEHHYEEGHWRGNASGPERSKRYQCFRPLVYCTRRHCHNRFPARRLDRPRIRIHRHSRHFHRSRCRHPARAGASGPPCPNWTPRPHGGSSGTTAWPPPWRNRSGSRPATGLKAHATSMRTRGPPHTTGSCPER